MNKAILVIDMPDSCFKCPVCASYKASAFSSREYWCATNGKDVEQDSKPDWCPLKPLPKKYDIEAEKNKPHDRDCDWEFESGYNVCIDEILGD